MNQPDHALVGVVNDWRFQQLVLEELLQGSIDGIRILRRYDNGAHRVGPNSNGVQLAHLRGQVGFLQAYLTG